MSNLGYATVDVIPSIKGAPSQLARELDGQTRGVGVAAGKKIGDETGSAATKSFGSKFSAGIGNQLKAVGGAVVGYAIGRFFVDSVNASSDLNESLNLNRVIFGQLSNDIIEWSETSAEAFGLSQQAALQAAGQFGDMFNQLGFADDTAASMSQDVVKLAADLGSFKNLGTEDVLERISAGFRGEYDSLQLLIPNITAARVQTEAMAMFGVKNADALTAQQKAAATLSIIQKDGAASLDDFAETADGAANSQKRLSAEWTDAQAEFGEKLLPALVTGTNFLIDDVVPAFSDFLTVTTDVVGGISDLPGPIKVAGASLLVLYGTSKALQKVGLAEWFNDLGTQAQFAGKHVAPATGLMQKATRGASAFLAANGKTIAGAVGIGLALDGLQSSVDESGASFSSWQTSAGGALAGFAVGGAVGAGVGFVAGQVTGLAKAWTAEGDATKEAHIDADNFIGSLSGSIDSVKAELAGLEEQMDGFGFTDAITSPLDVIGSSSARDAAIDKLRDLESASQVAQNTVNNLLQSVAGDEFTPAIFMSEYATAAQVLSDANIDLSKSLDPAETARAESILADYYKTQREGVEPTEQAAGAFGELASKLADSDEAASSLKDALSELIDPQLNADKATIAYEESLDELERTLRKGKQTLNVNTAAGRENRTAVIDTVSALKERIGAEADAGASAEKLSRLLELGRRDLLDQAAAAGFNRREVRDLAEQYGLTPKLIKTTLEALGLDRANRDARTYKDTLNDLDGTTATTYVVTKARIDTVMNRLNEDGLPRNADGGQIRGRGHARQDNLLSWVSNREWIHPVDSVDYYGEDFMRAVQNRTWPKYAAGGQVGGRGGSAALASADVMQQLLQEIRLLRTQVTPVAIANPDALDGRTRRVARSEYGSQQSFESNHGRMMTGAR